MSGVQQRTGMGVFLESGSPTNSPPELRYSKRHKHFGKIKKMKDCTIGSGPWDIVSTGLAALYIYIPLVVTDSLTATLEFEQKE